MKKLVCILVALVCTCSALAESGPTSPSIRNLTGSFVTAENLSDAAAAGLFIEPMNEYYEALTPEEYERLMGELEIELEKLEDADSITDYFGTVYVSSTGDQVPLIDLFDGKEPDLFEFEPVVAGGFDLTYGDVTADLVFPTPYELGEHVAVLIGVVYIDDEDEQHITWVAHDGVSIEIPQLDETDGIEVHFRAEMVDTMQNRDVMLAIASEHHEAEQE